MYDDYEQRVLEIASFLSNKIKRCLKCSRELHYKEKFNYTGRVCNRCRGMKPFDTLDDIISLAKINPSSQIRNLDLSQCKDKGTANRSAFEQQISNQYPEWQLLREKAEKKWNKKHLNTEQRVFDYDKLSCNEMISDERVGDIFNQYDTHEIVDISNKELISLLWEIRFHRGI
ncbi:hypothetical protein AALP86_14345 [Klebsiella pasteurii]|uniref:hypothetical protein n=1 Tax=Klebsiella pasteurii TaxID=2587529 RepID=UPI003512981C